MKARYLFPVAIIFAAISVSVIPAFSQDKASEPSVSGKGTYRIGNGDFLEINVWKEPDLSGEIFVRTDGMISLPLLNDVKAVGKTPMQLKEDIEKRLQAFVEGPSVTVIVREATSRKFYILGEVVQTGEYPLLKDLSVLQAFALAGGFSEWAAKTKIILLRREDGKEKVFSINYKDIIKGKDFSQNVPLKADDTIIVP
ncbi:MAG: hypothetical protein BA868_08525 [Desulfobacterales bacterium C00003106]|jgi:polysaccharide export outer membrane protein|nr:MAG: hypothetical protein BA868_08525 [Desulfobacterales bacterium C00003106]